MTESNLPRIQMEVLKRVVPGLRKRVIPLMGLGLPDLCELRLRYGAKVVGASEVRRTLSN